MKRSHGEGNVLQGTCSQGVLQGAIGFFRGRKRMRTTVPNPSIERTASSKLESAAHVER